MAGIAGLTHSRDRSAFVGPLLRMAAALRHRGPAGYGIFADEHVGLTHVRADATAGGQPVANEDGAVIGVAQACVANQVELRSELEAYRHRFRTGTTAELLVHAYEQWGVGMLRRLNGDFAFAVYDRARRILLLARDRFGVCPLFYTIVAGGLIFGSEVKALLATGAVRTTPDYIGLDEAFTMPGVFAPRTPFAGVRQLEPGGYGIWRGGRLRTARYYDLPVVENDLEPIGAVSTLDALLRDSIARRVPADGPIGARRVEGVDMAATYALAMPDAAPITTIGATARAGDHHALDRSALGRPGAAHHAVAPLPNELAESLVPAVRHVESPVVDLTPATMYLVARAARDRGVRVLLGSDGAAELFGGHDLYKETEVRLFCLRQPTSRARPALFGRIYPEIRHGDPAADFWRRAILSVGHPSDPLFSHMPRFATASRIKDFYSPDVRLALAGADPLAELRRRLPSAFATWSSLNRAAYLEIATRLASYQLSACADRVTFAHGIELRHPFLDHRLVEFAALLPGGSRLRGLRGMEILHRWSGGSRAGSTPFTMSAAPLTSVDGFFAEHRPSYVDELLSVDAVEGVGFWDVESVNGLVRRGRAGRITSAAERQAVVAILSTQLWFRQFSSTAWLPEPLPLEAAEVVLLADVAGAAGVASVVES